MYLVQDTQQIKWRYLRSWFVLDVIAVFPLAFLLEIYESIDGGSMNSSKRYYVQFTLRWGCTYKLKSAHP
jgi:hypothetical protein